VVPFCTKIPISDAYQRPNDGWMFRLQSRTLLSCSMRHPTTYSNQFTKDDNISIAFIENAVSNKLERKPRIE